MTINKGEPWGTVGPAPPDRVVVSSDAEAGTIVRTARQQNTPVPPLVILGGDLARTFGEPTGASQSLQLPVDLGAVLLDGSRYWFVSSLVAGRALARGRSFIAMNGAWLDGMNIAPKAHPNDGLLDFLDADLTFRQSIEARRRALLGDHLPHPLIKVHRTAALQVDLPRPTKVELDGLYVGRFRSIRVHCEPDALTVIV